MYKIQRINDEPANKSENQSDLEPQCPISSSAVMSRATADCHLVSKRPTTKGSKSLIVCSYWDTPVNLPLFESTFSFCKKQQFEKKIFETRVFCSLLSITYEKQNGLHDAINGVNNKIFFYIVINGRQRTSGYPQMDKEDTMFYIRTETVSFTLQRESLIIVSKQFQSVMASSLHSARFIYRKGICLFPSNLDLKV